MSQLFVISDSLGHNVEFLDLLSILAAVLGISVITNKNPIGALLWLIGLFGIISIYLILSGLTFIGFSYLVVYIGAVSILFLFILMLIDIRTSELQSNNSNSIPLALFVSIFLSYALFQILPYYLAILNSYSNKLNIFMYNSLNKNQEAVNSLIHTLKNKVMFISSNS
jgi:NADH-ubiquinone oxidoreductase chain 6